MELAVAGLLPFPYGDGIVTGDEGIVAVLVERLVSFLREKIVFILFFVVEGIGQEFEAVDREPEIGVRGREPYSKRDVLTHGGDAVFVHLVGKLRRVGKSQDFLLLVAAHEDQLEIRGYSHIQSARFPYAKGWLGSR